MLRGAINLQTLETVEFVWTTNDTSFYEEDSAMPERIEDTLATRDCDLSPLNVVFTVRTSDGRTTRRAHRSKHKDKLRGVSAHGRRIYPVRRGN